MFLSPQGADVFVVMTAAGQQIHRASGDTLWVKMAKRKITLMDYFTLHIWQKSPNVNNTNSYSLN